MSLTRRAFCAAVAGAARAVLAADRPIRLGGPIFLKSDDPRELAREHRRLGYSAAYCPSAKADDTVHVRAIETAFAAENVVIAEVGAWCNMLDPDPVKRQRAVKALGHVGTADPAAIPAITEALKDSNTRVRAEAALALLNAGLAAKDAVPGLEKAQNDKDAMVRSYARKALERIRDVEAK